MGYEVREDIVDVLDFFPEQLAQVPPDRVPLLQRSKIIPAVVRAPARCGCKPEGRLPELTLNLVVQPGQLGEPTPRLSLLLLGGAENDGSTREVEKHEDQHPDEENGKLQWDLQKGAHQQRHSPLGYGACRQVTLHLALVTTKVGQHQKGPSQQTRPERISARRIK